MSQYVKIKFPNHVKFASQNGKLNTLEGKINYQVVDALLIGVQGEHWPISRSKFELTYEPISPLTMGMDGA